MKQFGPVKLIDKARVKVLLVEDKWRHILTLMVNDVPYEDLPESEKPSDEELEQRGETRDEFSMGMHYASVGCHRVNVQEWYETALPMPENLELEDADIWFEEDGLPTERENG